jgi:predicted nucleotidyltransferase component of viral defense system
MYSVDEMRAYADRLGFGEAYMAEKDYLQELLLRALFSRIVGDRLVFRGGTALAKIYGSGRFSDDLDFVVNRFKKEDALLSRVEDAIRSIKDLYEMTFTGPETYRDMVGYNIKINGPLFVSSKHEASRQTVSLNINMYEKIILAPVSIIRTPIYNDIPPYSLSVKQLEELLMDKIAALMERKRLPARDLYDIWVILAKNQNNLDESKIKKVYDAYCKNKEKIDYPALASRIDALSGVWKKEIGSLMNLSIDFDVVARDAKSRLKEILGL